MSSASTRRSTTRPRTSSAGWASSRPDGVDVFFDNVGGETLDAVLLHLARGARIVISGGLSQYNADSARGPSNYLQLLVVPRIDDRVPRPTTPTAMPRPAPRSRACCATVA